MAIFNEILVGRYNKALQRAFGIKASAPVRQLGGEIMPTTSIFRGVEERYLESWFRWAIAVNLAAGVGNVGTIQVRNPTASNVLAVIEKVTLASTGAEDFSVGYIATTTDLVTSVTAVTLDTRIQVAQGAALVGSSTNASTPPGPLAQEIARGGGVSIQLMFNENQEVVITPGFAYRVQGDVANQIMIVTIQWRERYLEESERL